MKWAIFSVGTLIRGFFHLASFGCSSPDDDLHSQIENRFTDLREVFLTVGEISLKPFIRIMRKISLFSDQDDDRISK